MATQPDCMTDNVLIVAERVTTLTDGWMTVLPGHGLATPADLSRCCPTSRTEVSLYSVLIFLLSVQQRHTLVLSSVFR